MALCRCTDCFSLVARCPSLSCVWLFCDPMDCSLPGSSVYGTFQARILEWVTISSSRESSWPRDWTCVSWISYIGRQILCHCATWEDHHGSPIPYILGLKWHLTVISHFLSFLPQIISHLLFSPHTAKTSSHIPNLKSWEFKVNWEYRGNQMRTSKNPHQLNYPDTCTCDYRVSFSFYDGGTVRTFV